MKKVLLGAFLTLVALALMAQVPYFYTLIVRTALIDYGTLTVTGVTTLNSALVGTGQIRGADAFAGTATTDTVSIAGVTSTDVFVATQTGAADTIAALQVQALTGKIVVRRLASQAEANATYNFIRIQ